MNNEIKKLTPQQALEQGYVNFGYKGLEYQTLNDLSDITDEDIERGVCLFSKEYTTPTCQEDIQTFLADHIQDNWSSETQDDTNDVYEAIMAIDLSDIADRINKVLEDKKYYTLTDIELVTEDKEVSGE
ncbi:Uncharacterised protein [Sphingobacterium multivorum]|uniref:hypothetical protein n=1 Tax=Sphingobacterium multivorum TaxID=28454 RepID=UPI000E06CA37|nr:hypothetical protein [Sphingobacterium multivorum]QQT43321.1 hypothetical protein I6J00_16375 [Sphingobacterium multivorum]QQT44926.1 hypothetical protein I6J00_25055 [Sphingobacterium multivorum]SUI98714.1 Uncharacterised protein [Sphingobacterium multivorum]SUJ18444.1 Uncharacterised protein [Sphingobacterium multivorum]